MHSSSQLLCLSTLPLILDIPLSVSCYTSNMAIVLACPLAHILFY